MNIRAYTQRAGVLALILGFAVGCAQQATQSGACEPTTAVKNAISSAEAAARRAANADCASSDSEDLLERAADAAKSCNMDEAIKLANQAAREAEGSLAQCNPSAGGMGNHQVSRGDTLWGISAMSSVYGDPYQWPLIYKANASIIKDADLIYPGQNLEFKRNPLSSEVNSAIRHAKSRGAWSVGVVEETDKSYLAE